MVVVVAHASFRPVVALSILLLASLAGVPSGAAGTSAVAAGTECPAATFDAPGVGPACRLGNGLLRVFAPDGTPMGTTHGLDAAPSPATGTGSAGWPERQPACVDAATATHYMQVVYAVANDRPDLYGERLGDVRAIVREANGMFDAAAMLSGVHADLRVACSGGDIDVAHAVLPIAHSSASFVGVSNALASLGYNRSTVRYWVVYADGAGGGTANIYDDSRLAEDNAHNGGPALYAVTFGFSAHTMLHEVSHNLGAVQRAAPNSTPGWHCTDEADVMCYDDKSGCAAASAVPTCGAVIGGAVTMRQVCPAPESFDCNQDDYFHADPPEGNYLASHWNLGSRLNRYVRFEGSVLDPPACDARAATGDRVRCLVSGGNPEASGVAYTLDWGDGTVTRSPDGRQGAEGHPAGQPVELEHRYTAPGDYTLTVQAADAASPRTSVAIALPVQVRDAWAPEGLAVDCPRHHSRPAALECTVVAEDVDSGLRYSVDWGDGSVDHFSGPAHPSGQPVTVSHAYASDGDVQVSVQAKEAGGPLLSPVVTVPVHLFQTDTSGPAIEILDPAPGAVVGGCAQRAAGADPAATPVAVSRGCLRIRLSDDHTGVAWARVRIPAACGALADTTHVAPPAVLEVEYDVCQAGESTSTVDAADGWGNPSQASVAVLHVPGAKFTQDTALDAAETARRAVGNYACRSQGTARELIGAVFGC